MIARAQARYVALVASGLGGEPVVRAREILRVALVVTGCAAPERAMAEAAAKGRAMRAAIAGGRGGVQGATDLGSATSPGHHLRRSA